MNVAPSVWIVCYDICQQDRLRRVYKVMRSWGDPIQYSVFRCLLSPVQLARLQGALQEVIHGQEDQVVFIPLGAPDGPMEKKVLTLGAPLLYPERVAKVF
ncbi:MAG TPA: CRISPR-associated endonuclease Cas2 [Myxococcota bacterium]|nr:CRISPR-associated endonuclease Cas2 [Myxococcota bacterium]